MKRNRRDVKPRNGHVLHNQCIGTRFTKLAYQLLNSIQFVVINDGVDRDIHLRPEQMCKVRQPADVVHPVRRRSPRSKCRCTDIDSIGTVTYRLDTDIGVFRRSE